MARILISHVTPFPNKLTGISVYVWAIATALARHGRHEYTLATNWDEERLPAAVRGCGMAIVSRRVPRNESAAAAVNTLALPLLKRRIGARLIFHPQPTAMVAGMRNSVVVIHDLYRVTNPELHGARQRLQWEHVTARGFRSAARLIAVSGATRDALLAAYPDLAGRIDVVHEASPIDAGEAAARRRGQDGGEGARYLLMVANITANKNVGLLFAALHALAGQGLRPKVRLVGRDEAGALPALFARFPDADVEALGPVDDATLAALYAGAQAYINTSLVEGFCLPILEAHALGVPVICSDIPVLREVAGEGALFVDPRSAEALAAAIRALIENPALAAKLRARALANGARFGWDKAARETEAVFDRVLAATGRAV